MAANSYLTDARLASQRPSARAIALPSPVAVEPGYAAPGRRAAVRRRDLAVPSWAVFCMIMLATFAVCVTVTMRTHARMGAAAEEHRVMSADVQKISETNKSLRREVERLRAAEVQAVEAAARDRMNMVRANEIVVPLD